MFGARQYDAFAIDLWSLGCLFADFFMPLELEEEEDDGYDFPPHEGHLIRKSLFDASRGDIALIWSIFKTLGTPTSEIWPVKQPFLLKISF